MVRLYIFVLFELRFLLFEVERVLKDIEIIRVLFKLSLNYFVLLNVFVF